jgi:hypothetical protein
MTDYTKITLIPALPIILCGEWLWLLWIVPLYIVWIKILTK